jgi:hypothetical protein
MVGKVFEFKGKHVFFILLSWPKILLSFVFFFQQYYKYELFLTTFFYFLYSMAVLQFRSEQCAADVIRCYTSVVINKIKLKISKKKDMSGSEKESTPKKTPDKLEKKSEYFCLAC